jgi:hypothetical protein
MPDFQTAMLSFLVKVFKNIDGKILVNKCLGGGLKRNKIEEFQNY